jgi:hypothetical protein
MADGLLADVPSRKHPLARWGMAAPRRSAATPPNGMARQRPMGVYVELEMSATQELLAAPDAAENAGAALNWLFLSGEDLRYVSQEMVQTFLW